MQASQYIPHVDLIVQAMRISRERLNGRSKVAIDVQLLHLILRNLVSHMPFSDQFYRTTYADIGAAAAAGQMPDLHRHFVETGWFEGRLGTAAGVDEAFYLATYPDVARAIERGEVGSAADHYARSGAAEGRVPSAALRPEVLAWMGLLRIAMAPES